jgi:hypothetical protein
MTEPKPSAPQLPEGRFVGRQAFVGLVRQAIECAAREGWPSLLLSDADFADWPLGERAVVEALNAWAGRGRQLRLLAQDYGPLRLQHPRFVQWRVTWAHLVEAQVWSGAAGGELPSAIWSPGWTLERLDPLRCAGVSSFDGARRVALRERLDAAWHRGGPGFAATVLGL